MLHKSLSSLIHSIHLHRPSKGAQAGAHRPGPHLSMHGHAPSRHQCSDLGKVRAWWHYKHAAHQRCFQLPASQAVASTQVLENPLLGDIRVVLVAPKTPANIGAVARCAANFEATQLWVVAPRCDPKSGEAYKVACGDTILDSVVVVEDLQAALADTSGSVGFTRRAGATRLTYASISDMLSCFPTAIPNMTLSGTNPQGSLAQYQAVAPVGVTAIVLGREESGLTEAELRLCSHACAIPTGRIQGSMNLSHATSVVLYELYQRRQAYNNLLAADAATREAVLSGSLPSSHPAAHTFAAVPWLLPLASAGGPQVSNTDEVPDKVLPGAASQQGSSVQQQVPNLPETLQPAITAELEALLTKVADIAHAVGLSGEESRGGGNQGNHGRKRLPVGHIRALLARARPIQGEIRSLHGLASKILAVVDPGHKYASRSTSLSPDRDEPDSQT